MNFMIRHFLRLQSTRTVKRSNASDWDYPVAVRHHLSDCADARAASCF